MHFASVAVTTLLTGDLVPPLGDLSITPLPQRKRKGNVDQRSKYPEPWHLAAQVAKGRRAAVPVARSVDDNHLLHHLVVSQIRIALSHDRIVQRNKRQPACPIPPRKPLHLPTAKVALAIKNNDIRVGAIRQTGQFDRGGGGSSGCFHGNYSISETLTERPQWT